MDWIGLDWIGLDLDWIGLVWIGLVWFGLDWIGWDWIGLVWIGLVWIGLAWIGLDWIRLGGSFYFIVPKKGFGFDFGFSKSVCFCGLLWTLYSIITITTTTDPLVHGGGVFL